MTISSVLAVSAPSGVWANLIEWVHSWVGGGYGWTILVLIVLVKLVLSPLDYLIKHSNKKTNLVQQKVAPQLAKLQKKYGENQQMIQQQTQALYKREGHSMIGSCVIMLVNLVLTMVIFFTLFSGLRTLSSYQSIQQYEHLHNTYVESVSSVYGSYDDYCTIVNKINTDGIESLTEAEKALWDGAMADAAAAVQNEWVNTADSWLWIDNIWVTDGHKSPFPTLEALQEMATSSKVEEYIDATAKISDDVVLKTNYSQISSMIETKTGTWNGYYILAILSVGLSVLSQYITELSNKHKNKTAQNIVNAANPQNKSMWFMKLLLPVMMAIFVFTTNAAFGIYVVTNSIISIITGSIINLIIGAVFKKKQAEVDEYLLKEANKIEKKANKGAAK